MLIYAFLQGMNEPISIFHECYYHYTAVVDNKEWGHIFTMGALWLWGCMVWHGQTVGEYDKKAEIGRQGVNRQMRVRATVCDVWVLTLTPASSCFYLQYERTGRAGWGECSARGYTPPSGIQISAHTKPIEQKKSVARGTEGALD